MFFLWVDVGVGYSWLWFCSEGPRAAQTEALRKEEKPSGQPHTGKLILSQKLDQSDIQNSTHVASLEFKTKNA